eukprot:scaffold1954_cov268-Pinguiococcus_pyrenoidosus.AAC.315
MHLAPSKLKGRLAGPCARLPSCPPALPSSSRSAVFVPLCRLRPSLSSSSRLAVFVPDSDELPCPRAPLSPRRRAVGGRGLFRPDELHPVEALPRGRLQELLQNHLPLLLHGRKLLLLSRQLLRARHVRQRLLCHLLVHARARAAARLRPGSSWRSGRSGRTGRPRSKNHEFEERRTLEAADPCRVGRWRVPGGVATIH